MTKTNILRAGPETPKRCVVWVQWKTRRKRYHELRRLGVSERMAFAAILSHRGPSRSARKVSRDDRRRIPHCTANARAYDQGGGRGARHFATPELRILPLMRSAKNADSSRTIFWIGSGVRRRGSILRSRSCAIVFGSAMSKAISQDVDPSNAPTSRSVRSKAYTCANPPSTKDSVPVM